MTTDINLKFDLLLQAESTYLRLANKYDQVAYNWEHTPTVDYEQKTRRLIRLMRKANKRLERRIYAAEAEL